MGVLLIYRAGGVSKNQKPLKSTGHVFLLCLVFFWCNSGNAKLSAGQCSDSHFTFARGNDNKMLETMPQPPAPSPLFPLEISRLKREQ